MPTRKSNRSRVRLGERLLSYVVLSVFALGTLLPLVGVIFSAVTPAQENNGGFAVPRRVALGNFAAAWERGHFGSYLFSSVTVTIAVLVLTGTLAIFAGFAFAKLRFAGKGAIFAVLLLGLLLPTEAFIIPLYFNLRSVGLTDTYFALILPQTAQSLGFAIFWMRNQFLSFPDEIIEAARMDGASDAAILWRIMVPSSSSALATMCLLVGMWTWNEFLLPLVLVTNEARRTAPLGLAFFKGAHMSEYSLMSAAGIMVAIPIVVAYLLLQKRFISGMLGGINLK